PNSNGYGYQWWLKEGAFAASGHGGNHIFCVPGDDLVVAIASKLSSRPRDRWLLLNEYVLPAIDSECR
ncbi:MAG: 6-aminohexanoate hydrolase, partial [Halobacteriota archaeon]|nr:6-aminohexanoate hydrolase [Halobacteriota archaeon]